MKNKLSNVARALALALIVVFTLSVFEIPVLAGSIEFDVTIQHDQSGARDMLTLVNELRYSDGVETPLTYDYGLEQIAIRRAVELGTTYDENGEGSGISSDDLDALGVIGILCELQCYGESSTYGAFSYWREEGDETQHMRNEILSSSYVACGIAHVIFNGEHYWAMELCTAASGASYTAPDDTVEYSTVSMDLDNCVFSASPVKDSESVYVEYEQGQTYDYPQIVVKCRRSDSAGNSFIVDPSQYTI